ncbi:vomeronasal type-2 receptor 1-like [Phyllobates terribilis]|uniref:vomeronasal type-2 receptor 1-like n=1 Tax=Phyllobates terribilis TaxID=111132 RepID=UPI003CCA9C6D
MKTNILHIVVALVICLQNQHLVCGQECRLIGKFDLHGFVESKNHELIIGGMFPFHFRTILSNDTDMEEPKSPKCEGQSNSSDSCDNQVRFDPNNLSSIIRKDNPQLKRWDSTLPPSLSIKSLPYSSSLNVIQVGYASSCSVLSDKFQFPSFLRTIPSDQAQSRAFAYLVTYFGWTWVGTIAADDDYGKYGIKGFKEEVETKSVCIAFSETLPRIYNKDTIDSIVKVIRGSSANVIVIFSSDIDLSPLMEALAEANITGKTYLSSEAWTTSALIAKPQYFSFLGGTIGFAIRRAEMPDFQNFLLDIHPEHGTDDLVYEFWEEAFNCTWPTQRAAFYTNISIEAIVAGRKRNISPQLCTGKEQFKDILNTYTDVSELRITYSVYKSIYTIATALHDMDACVPGLGPFPDKACANVLDFEPWQSPVSVCSKSCVPGTRKGIRQGEPVCCFDCISCADGEITNETDARECISCSSDYWSNAYRNECVLKEVEFLATDEALGITLIFLAVFGASLVIAFTIIYIMYRETALVKANDRSLSFLIQVSLVCTFMTSIIFVGKPEEWSCMARQTTLALGFSLCLSCILGKTIVLMLAKRAAKSKMAEKPKPIDFKPLHQKIVAITGLIIEVGICTAYLISMPPWVYKNMESQNIKIILECNEGSIEFLCSMFGFDVFLAILCFITAFVARKLPDNFNEAKFITFGMLVFFIVWISFVPAYLSTRGKFKVAVEIFAILASSFGLLGCIYVPKGYIILIKPERNTEEIVGGKAATNDKSAPATSASITSEVNSTTVSTIVLDD